MFFFNPSTRMSLWERPDDLYNRADVDRMILESPPGLDKGKQEETTGKDNKYTIHLKSVRFEALNLVFISCLYFT